MKERVEELARECGLYQGKAQDDCPVCSAFDYEKFAQAIHNEALEMAANLTLKRTAYEPDAEAIRKLKVN